MVMLRKIPGSAALFASLGLASVTAARLRSSGPGWPASPCAVACAELPDDYSESDCRNAPTA